MILDQKIGEELTQRFDYYIQSKSKNKNIKNKEEKKDNNEDNAQINKILKQPTLLENAWNYGKQTSKNLYKIATETTTQITKTATQQWNQDLFTDAEKIARCETIKGYISKLKKGENVWFKCIIYLGLVDGPYETPHHCGEFAALCHYARHKLRREFNKNEELKVEDIIQLLKQERQTANTKLTNKEYEALRLIEPFNKLYTTLSICVPKYLGWFGFIKNNEVELAALYPEKFYKRPEIGSNNLNLNTILPEILQESYPELYEEEHPLPRIALPESARKMNEFLAAPEESKNNQNHHVNHHVNHHRGP